MYATDYILHIENIIRKNHKGIITSQNFFFLNQEDLFSKVQSLYSISQK